MSILIFNRLSRVVCFRCSGRTSQHNSIFNKTLSTTRKNHNDNKSIEQFEQPQQNTDVPEEEFVLSSLTRSNLVPEVPLMSLNIEKRINKVEKRGSFTADIFTGAYDDDYLTYPDPLDSRIENQQLKEQATMVRQLWPQIWNDNLQLKKFNFYNLYQLSVTEMMTIFEAIGASSRACYENSNLPLEQQTNNSPGVDVGSMQNQQQQLLVTKSIINLITRNCLTYWPLAKSENPKIKEILPKKHILFGGASVDDSVNDEQYLPIGFCWSEQAPQLGSLPPQDWSTLAQHGGKAIDQYLITGKKNKVLHDDSSEHYLLYYRDKFLAEKCEKSYPDEEPNPASDPFVGCCLLHRSELNFSSIYQDSAGFKYTDVDIDTTIPGDRLVFPAARRDPRALNIKALGQLASCTVTLGLLKDTLRRTYIYLIDQKRGLLSCDIIERKLAYVTSKIFALESMIYYIAGMYDGLQDGFDAHMEATVLKIVTHDFAYEILQNIQQISGSEMFILSKLQDQVNIYDSFLDGNIYNRLYLATMGIIWFARSKNIHLNQLRLAPWYPGYFFKHAIKEKCEQSDYLTLNADIYGNLHPSLKEAAINLEYIVKRVKWASEDICMKHGTDVTSAQTSLYQLAQLSVDSFLLTTMCARASKSYCNGSRHSELDVSLTSSYSWDLARRVKLYMEEIQTTAYSALCNRSREINELNLKYGGYYAESPLDPNI